MPGTPVSSFEIKTALLRSDAASSGEVQVELRQRADGSQRFEVEAEGLPTGQFDLVVAGQIRGTLSVTAATSRTRGEIEFESSPADDDEQTLNFDVLGQEVDLEQGGTALFSRVLAQP